MGEKWNKKIKFRLNNNPEVITFSNKVIYINNYQGEVFGYVVKEKKKKIWKEFENLTHEIKLLKYHVKL